MQVGVLAAFPVSTCFFNLRIKHPVTRRFTAAFEPCDQYMRVGLPMVADCTVSPPRARADILRRREINGQTELIMRKSIKRRGSARFIRPSRELARQRNSSSGPVCLRFTVAAAAAAIDSLMPYHGYNSTITSFSTTYCAYTRRCPLKCVVPSGPNSQLFIRSLLFVRHFIWRFIIIVFPQ